MKPITRYRIDIALVLILTAILLLHVFKIVETPVLIITTVIGFIPVLFGAYQSFREGEWASMDLLASIALIFSLLSHQWASAVFIELMLAAARILEDVTRDRTEKSIRGLLKLRPSTAKIERNGSVVVVPLADIRVGDVVVVDIEDRIPVDGIVLFGTAAVDESSISGESLPVDKTEGSKAMSSTLVRSGSLRINTTHTGKDTTLERIIALVESAREEKPDSQTTGEKFGKIYLISIFVGSILLYVFTRNILLVLSVVLVVCADDIAVAVPIAYLRAIRAAARIGVIAKGSKHLETFGKITTIVFDKTGTLTTGTLAVSKVIPVEGYTERDVLTWSMSADIRSTHPISRAIVEYATSLGIPEQFPDSAEEKGGRGIIAKRGDNTVISGKELFLKESNVSFPPQLVAAALEQTSLGESVSYTALNGKVIGCIAAADTVKKNAAKAIKKLREVGIKKVVMLTGDNSHAAESIAMKLGIDEWHADLLPENKVEIIAKLQKDGPVAMVGDGVNDAAALSIADVGIAMGGLGSEGTIESAEIIIMRDDLGTLPSAILLARKAKEVSVADFWIWGITNAVGLVLVFTHVIGPVGAAAYNFLSDFLPLSYSLRVRIKATR